MVLVDVAEVVADEEDDEVVDDEDVDVVDEVEVEVEVVPSMTDSTVVALTLVVVKVEVSDELVEVAFE